MKLLLSKVAFIFTLYATTEAYKILGLFIHPGRSHYVVFSPLMKGLALRGHNVTIVSYFPEKVQIPNYVDLTFNQQVDITESFNISRYQPINYWSYFREMYELAEWGKVACEGALNDPIIDRILEMHKNDPFDLVITEFFDTDCMLGVIYKMQVPFIGLSSCALMPWHTDRIGTVSTPSYIASEFVGFTEHMSYYQRFVSFTVTTSVKYLYRILVEWSDNKMLAEKFGDDVIPDVNDIARNTSLIFVNQHFSLHQPRATTPNLIEIGGIHIKDPKTLEKDLKEILDTAKRGVILMSWGSMVNASTMDPRVRQVFTDVFRGLDQTIVWKYEADKMEDKPNNVILRKWIPQRDILCHPNVKVFITHGGMLGTTEAIYCGVPVIVIPFYGDQPLNGAAMEYRGIGKLISYENIERDTMRKAILRLLSKEVQNKAQAMSDAFKDRPISSLDNAIYWCEYVIRTKGELIRTNARHMNWFVYHSLDVILPLAITFSCVLYMFFKISLFIFKTRGNLKEKPRKKQKVR